jgi:hypothetical protein
MLPGQGSALASYLPVGLTSLPVGGLNPSIPGFIFNDNYLTFFLNFLSEKLLSQNRESNPGPAHYECAALPSEPSWLIFDIYYNNLFPTYSTTRRVRALTTPTQPRPWTLFAVLSVNLRQRQLRYMRDRILSRRGG